MASLYDEMVAAHVRWLLAEDRRTQHDLCVSLGWSDQALSRRLTGEVSFSLTEIEQIAAALDVPCAALLAAPVPEPPERQARNDPAEQSAAGVGCCAGGTAPPGNA